MASSAVIIEWDVLILHLNLNGFACERLQSMPKHIDQMIHSRHIIIPLAAIVFFLLAGCRPNSATMRQLIHIDSMVYHQQEKEALPLLQQMDTRQFSKRERAYHAVLLSMAMYKNYILCTSDSAINKAVGYFRNSGDDLMYLKALVAQGCVNEDMGKLEQAVESYHRAEQLPLATDSSMIAYAKLRLGTLYQSQVVGTNTIALEKYKEALPIYKALGNSHYELVCLTSIGGIYRNIDEKHDSAVVYLKDAIALAQRVGDQYHAFANRYLLSEYYLVRVKNYQLSKQYGLQAIKADKAIIDHPRAHYRLAECCLLMGLADSAVYFLNNAPKPATARDSVLYYELMSEMEHRRWKNEEKSKYYIQQAHAIADSITINGLNHRLLEVEKKYDVQLAELNQVKNQSRLRGAMLVSALLALGLLALAFMVWRYKNRLKMKQNEAEMLKTDLEASLVSLRQMQKRLDDYEQSKQDDTAFRHQGDQLRSIINQQIDNVHKLMEWSYQFDSEKFAAKFKEMMSLPPNGADSGYWTNLQALVNDLHDNILNQAQEAAGGTLTDSELNLLALYCCGFSRTVIMLTMGYRNIGTVYNKKIQIAKKLGVTDLDVFVNRWQQKNQL